MRRVLGTALVLIAAWFGWQWWFPDEEAQIRALLERVAAAIESGEGSGGVDALAAVAALQNEFAVDATVDAGPPFQRLAGRQAIVGAAARVRMAVRNLDVRFADTAISVADDRQSAIATVVGEAHFDDAHGGRGMDARELEIVLARVDGQWVITTVTLIQPLQRLQ